MTHFEYSIFDFKWDKTSNTFTANESQLHCLGYFASFPNQGRQFYICNPKSKGSRRFRLYGDYADKWIFTSEDGIMAIIHKEYE